MDHATQTRRTMEEARAALEVLAAARGLIDEDSLRARAEAILDAAGIPAPVEDVTEDEGATEDAAEDADATEDADVDVTDRDVHTIREVLSDAGYRESYIASWAPVVGRTVKSHYVGLTGELPVMVPEEQPSGYTADVAAYPDSMRDVIIGVAEKCAPTRGARLRDADLD